jgi:hypothetical protein
VRVLVTALAWVGVTSVAWAASSITTLAPGNGTAPSVMTVGTQAAPAPAPADPKPEDIAANIGDIRPALDSNGVSLPADVAKELEAAAVAPALSVSAPRRAGSITPMVIRGGEVGGAFNNASSATVETSEPVKAAAAPAGENKIHEEGKTTEAAAAPDSGARPNPDIPRVEQLSNSAPNAQQ